MNQRGPGFLLSKCVEGFLWITPFRCPASCFPVVGGLHRRMFRQRTGKAKSSSTLQT
jgi:hypothetical protein